MGLKEILEDIRKDSDSENTEVLSHAKLTADKMIVDKAEELNQYYSAQRSLLESEMKRLSSKLTAKAELDAFREKQRVELELIESLLQASYEELISYLKKNSEKYLEFLKKLVQNSLAVIRKNEIGISLNKEDEKYFPEIKKNFKETITLLPAVKIGGGVICISGDIYIDNSLENIFEKMKPDFTRLIAESMS